MASLNPPAAPGLTAHLEANLNGSRQPAATRICKVVFPSETNHYGTMFGGKLLELADTEDKTSTKFHLQFALYTFRQIPSSLQDPSGHNYKTVKLL